MCFLFILDHQIKTELINSEINYSFATDWKAQAHGALSAYLRRVEILNNTS